MRKDVWRVVSADTNAVDGRVVWAPVTSLWNAAMLLAAVILGPLYFSVGAFLVFLGLTYFTLLVGHSVGMHRLFIHRSYDCPKWLERILVYIGVLVGMSGPFGILRIHDVRDWAQRLPHCHDYFSHRRSFLVDAFWQLHCRFQFEHAPQFQIEPEFQDDPWYQWMERTWMLQQIPLALLLYALGGLPWVVWGICCRVAISVAGHWTVTYYCHNPGPGIWIVKDAGVQASNLNGIGLITMGECWHNNHHAFPESVRMGIETGQTDPGYRVVQMMARAGLAWNLGEPRAIAKRDDLEQVKC